MDILIGGLDEERTSALEAHVRRTVNTLGVVDVVTVAVLPSDAGDRWDIGVQRQGKWSVTTLDAAVENLSTEVTATLSESLKRFR